MINEEVQARELQQFENGAQTIPPENKEFSAQTSIHESTNECEAQTDIVVVENHIVQTPFPDLMDTEAQTDEIVKL